MKCYLLAYETQTYSDCLFYTKTKEKQDYWRMLQVDSMAMVIRN